MTPTDAHVLPLMSDPVQRSAWCSEMHTQMGGGHPPSSIRILKYLWIFLDVYASDYEKVLLVSSHWPETCQGTMASLSFSSIKVFSFPQSLYQRIHIGQHPPTLWHFYWQNSTEIFPKWKCWSALIAKAKMLRSNQTLVCQNSPGEGQVTHASLGSLTLGLILQHFAWLCYRTISYILDCYNVMLL